VALDRLLVVRHPNPARGIDIVLDVVRSEKAALVVLDWRTRRLDEKHLERLRANVLRTRCALVVLMNRAPSLGAVYTLLKLERSDWLTDEAGDVHSYRTRATVLRDGGTERDRSASIDIALNGAPT
jgi:hypothetical protein